MTEVSEEIPSPTIVPTLSSQTAHLTSPVIPGNNAGSDDEHTNTIETSHSEHSLQPYDLAEVSLVGEVFAAQQRAVILVVINAIMLLIFIYTVLF